MDYSSQFFQSILANSTDLISIIDAQGNYKFVGGSVTYILGFEAEEMVGTNAFSYIHEEDQAFTAAALQEAVSNKFMTLPPFRFKTLDGRWLWLECSISDMIDNADVQGFVTNSRDITDRVKEEQRKKRSQAHYESLFYNHPDAVFELDRKGYFTRVNQSVSKVLRYEDSQILGAHFQKFVYHEFMPEATSAFLNTLNGESQYLEISIVRGNGDIGVLGITVFPVIIDREVVSLQGIAKDITLQRKYDAIMKEQVELVNNIMERIPESFYSLDEKWRYTYVNDHYSTYMGKAKAELLGKVIWEIIPAATSTRFYQECLNVARTGVPVVLEEMITYNGNAFLRFQLFPATRGIIVHFVDITEKRREQDRLEKLSLVASKTATCVMILDAQRKIEWVNEAFEKATGYTQKDCANLTCPELLVGEETQLSTIARIKDRLKKGKSFKGEVLNYTKAGKKVWFYQEITPVYNKAGILNKFISIRTNITDRKQKEEELVEVARELYQQNIDLQQFSYMISHNLRAPAANVMGLTNILGMVDKSASMFDEILSKVKDSASALDGVIRDMNHILSIRERSQILDLEEVVLSDLFAEVLATLQYKLNRFEHAIIIDYDKRAVLKTNKAYLYEVIKNLLSNAIKFRKPDEMLRIHLKANQTGGQTEIVIQDNGIGMNMQVIGKDLFKLYKKFHKGYDGRGIGLFLVKTYLDALGGKVKVKSEPTQGSAFKIKFKNNVEKSLHY